MRSTGISEGAGFMERLPLFVRWIAALVFIGLLVVAQLSLDNTIEPNGIVIHHSALSADDRVRFPGPTDAAVIDALHQTRGFRTFYWGKIYHIGYQYLILPDGTIQTGRPEHCRGQHVEGHSSYIGICLIGNFSSVANPDGEGGLKSPTDAQMQSVAMLAESLQKKYKISCSSVFRHRDLKPGTLCPGDRFPWVEFRQRLGCGVSP